VPQVKDFRDQAEAMRAYARQAKNRQLETDAAEIRIRAERRIGELMAAQRETVGMASGGEHGGRASKDGFRENPSNARPTLAEAGIDKNLADRARKLARRPRRRIREYRRTLRSFTPGSSLLENHRAGDGAGPPCGPLTMLPTPEGSSAPGRIWGRYPVQGSSQFLMER
jgi:hypothetical protein